MKFRKFNLGSVVLAACLHASATTAAEGDIELYVDSTTQQIYAEPGVNRVRMGTFRPVPAASADPGSAPAADLPVLRLSDLETRVNEQAEHIEALAATQNRSAWASNMQLRGYLQNRYTEMLGGDAGINLWSDRSVGDADSLGDADKNFLIRRARLVLQGDIGTRLSIYVQPDFASTAGSTGHVAQMRDAYGDFYLTEDRVHRLRVGQSKVPFGFENLQSSSNRLALDRNDALNSAVRDERDLGLFYYYTPQTVQTVFNEINAAGLKHSGNYGMFGLGFYNGQGANRGDRNDDQHVVARMTYPWKFDDGQYFEAGIQAYSGTYVPSTGAYRAPGDVSLTPLLQPDKQSGYDDERIGVSALWYPQPFGLQAEWNWGRTPQLDLTSNTIREEELQGGYLQAMYMAKTRMGTVLPFIKWQYYDGANKAETNAPANDVNDLEIGVEWQIAREVELAAVYHRMRRNNLVTGNRPGRLDYEQFEAEALRLQLQFNYQ